MIVPMKKATVILQAKDASAAINDLRRLGILHIEHRQLPQAKDIAVLQEDLHLINACLQAFIESGLKAQAASAGLKFSSDWRLSARHIIDLRKRYDQLESYSRGLLNSIKEWERWGDFDPGQLQLLSEKGIYAKLFQVPIKQLGNFPDTAVVNKIFVCGGLAYCLVISRQKFECNFNEVALPKQSLSQMRIRLEEDRKTMFSIKNEILKSAGFIDELAKTRQAILKEVEFQQALLGMGRVGSIAYLSGYAPFDTTDALVSLAKLRHWAFLITEPSKEDYIPTLVRNPKWINTISPLFKLLEVVPGYRELDISLLFLVFFSMFFGMIIGDAGYGLVYFLFTLFTQYKFGQKISDKSAFFLFYTLSLCAIVWGLLTGTFFGQEWCLRFGLKPFIPILKDTKFLQAFCFFLGALHLSLAHSWKAMLKIPSPSLLAEIGWILLLWAGFFLAKMLVLGDGFPFFGKWFIITGVSLVILFTNLQKNILKGIGEGLSTVALSLVNNFTDVVSYVRLFAVGLAGVAIADTVNALAGGLGSGNVLAKVLIVFIGHSINFVLGPMSVLVHGVRLNVLEFSGHAGLTWSGIRYKPLTE